MTELFKTSVSNLKPLYGSKLCCDPYREQPKSTDIINPFWRSLAINPYDLFHTAALDDFLFKYMDKFYHGQMETIRPIINLRMIFPHRPQQLARKLETVLFAEQQIAQVAGDADLDKICFVVITMTLIVDKDALAALQLRWPSLQTSTNDSYGVQLLARSANEDLQKKRRGEFVEDATTLPTDIDVSDYNKQELADAALLHRNHERGAYLYDEMRKREPVSLAALVLESRSSECYKTQIVNAKTVAVVEKQERAKKRLATQKSKPASDDEDDDDCAVIDDDKSVGNNFVVDDDSLEDDDECSLSSVSVSETVASASMGEDTASSDDAKPDTPDHSDDSNDELSSISLSADGASEVPVTTRRGNITASSDRTDRQSESRAQEAGSPALVRRQVRNNANDDDRETASSDIADEKDDFDSKKSKTTKKRKVLKELRFPNEQGVQQYIHDICALHGTLQRPDELQWVRLVVSTGNYKIALHSVAPIQASSLINNCRRMTVAVESGSHMHLVSTAVTDETQGTTNFYVINKARLVAMLREIADETVDKTTDTKVDIYANGDDTPHAVDDVAIHNVGLTLETPTRVKSTDDTHRRNRDYSPRPEDTKVSREKLLARQESVAAAAELYVVDDEPVQHKIDNSITNGHIRVLTRPLIDCQEVVDLSKVTLYEQRAYARQRLMVLYAIYRANTVTRTQDEQEELMNCGLVNKYPYYSGASYHILTMLGDDALRRQPLHEGIGLMILCLCAKHDRTLSRNLIDMELQLLQLKEQRLRDASLTESDEMSDAEREDFASRVASVAAKIKEHCNSIRSFLKKCKDVMSPALQAQFVAPPAASSATQSTSTKINDAAIASTEFFSMIKEVVEEWKEAMEITNKDIAEKQEAEDMRAHFAAVPNIDDE